MPEATMLSPNLAPTHPSAVAVELIANIKKHRAEEFVSELDDLVGAYGGWHRLLSGMAAMRFVRKLCRKYHRKLQPEYLG